VDCGQHLLSRDVVRLQRTVVEITEGECEEAIKLVRTMDGNDGCSAGFIPMCKDDCLKFKMQSTRSLS
jgi:hypothetical protein